MQRTAFEIYIFDPETKHYEKQDDTNIWFITGHGCGKVNILNIDKETKIEQISRWKLRIIPLSLPDL